MNLLRRLMLVWIAAASLGAVADSDVAPGSGAWSPTGSLVTPRAGHTATLLADGRVLVVGGSTQPILPLHPGNNAVYLDSAEIYDPATGQWRETAPLGMARRGHTATRLLDGRVLVAGGDMAWDSSSNPLGFAEIFDPVTESWTLTGNMFNSQTFDTATLLRDGRVLLVGGVRATAELYDPARDTWSETSELNIPRWYHSAVLLADGKVLVAGGGDHNFPTDSDALTLAEIYDPDTNRWVAAGDAPVGTAGYPATLLLDGTVLIASGTQAPYSLIYDPAAPAWEFTASLVTRFFDTATRLRDGSVLAVGGSTYTVSAFTVYSISLGTVSRFDPETRTWSAAVDLPVPRFLHTATLLNDGSVLVAGGIFATGQPYAEYLATAERYVPPPRCEKNHYILCGATRLRPGP